MGRSAREHRLLSQFSFPGLVLRKIMPRAVSRNAFAGGDRPLPFPTHLGDHGKGVGGVTLSLDNYVVSIFT
jgi:hypothetical protein